MVFFYQSKSSEKCIIFIDRNVISKIKDLTTGKQVSEKQKSDIKNLDIERNTICALFSVIEGSSARKEFESDMLETAASDSKAIDNFFLDAKTDAKAYDNHLFSNITTPGVYFEKNFPILEDFLQSIYKELFDSIDPPSKKERQGEIKAPDDLAELILDFSNKYSVPSNHPTVLCLLGVAYRNTYAKKIMKIHEARKAYSDPQLYKRTIFNALNDICIIQRGLNATLYTLRFFKENPIKPPPSIAFFSFDEGLMGFLRHFSFKEIGSIKSTIIDEADINWFSLISDVKKIFPALIEDGAMYKKITQLLGRSQTSNV